MAKQETEVIGIDLPGRVKSLKLADRNMLLPLFEAIANSIHAIEDARISDGKINIHLTREDPGLFEDNDSSLPAINKFAVWDNGIGFTNENYNSFKKAHSTHKAARGGKGIGRFTWLKAFEDIKIESLFKEDQSPLRRSFKFNLKSSSGIEDAKLESVNVDYSRFTLIEMNGYKDPYRAKCPKKSSTIANRIIEHCLIYFLDPSCPIMSLVDKDITIDLNQKFNRLTEGNTFKDSFRIREHNFELTLIKWYEHEELDHHRLSLCANRREVKDFNLNKILKDLQGKFQDTDNGKFFFIAGYLESNYFDNHVNDERTEIEFSKEGLFDQDLISEKELYNALGPILKERFDTSITTLRNRKLEIIQLYIQEEAPQYRVLLKTPNVFDEIVVYENMPKQELDLRLYKLHQDVSFKIREDVNKIIGEPNNEQTPDLLKEKYEKVMNDLTDLQMSDLARYVVHRKHIIDLFEKSLGTNSLEKYELENTVHKIIYPTRTDSNNVDYDSQNLWLIDERLSFHIALYSDVALSSVEGLDTESDDRPDIVVFDSPVVYAETREGPLNSIVLIEFKRPMRNSYSGEDGNPIEQLYRYILDIRRGRKIQKNGRPYPIDDNTLFYAYLICDRSDKVTQYADFSNLRSTQGGMGYYGYNEALKCWIEILYYDSILSNAKKRNKILFHKLGI